MTDTNELQQQLSMFTCSDDFFFHPLNRRFIYTSGAKFFFDNAGGGAHWLKDILATEVHALHSRMRGGFMLISFNVLGTRGLITVKEDSDEPIIWQKDIDFTDCPAGEWKFYLIDNTLLLPSEY